jgi:hypothetical protein
MEADLCMTAVLAEDSPSMNRIRPASGFASPSLANEKGSLVPCVAGRYTLNGKEAIKALSID